MLKRVEPTARATRPRPIRWSWEGPLLFGVAFALRAAYAWVSVGPGGTPASDALRIDMVAWNLASGAGFAFDGENGPYPTAVVPPVVPFLTSLLYRAVGHDYFAAVLLQGAIGSLTPLLARALGGMWFGSASGRLAGWLCAVHPLLVFFSGYLLTEAAFTTALLAALVASVAWLREPRGGRALGAGLLWGVASLTRPTSMMLPLLVAAWAFVPLGLLVPGRERARQIGLLFGGVLLVMAPWSVRNSIVSGAFVPVKTGGGRTFLDANNPVTWADPTTRGSAGSVYDMEPYASQLRGRSEVAVDSIANAEAWRFLNAHRDEWPAMAAAKLGRFWRLTREAGGTGTWQAAGSPTDRLLRAVDPLLLWSLAVMPFALWGLVRALGGPRRWYLALGPLVILYFTLLTVLYWGSLRLRVPVEPLVAILAAAGFEDVRARLRRRRAGLELVPPRG